MVGHAARHMRTHESWWCRHLCCNERCKCKPSHPRECCWGGRQRDGLFSNRTSPPPTSDEDDRSRSQVPRAHVTHVHAPDADPPHRHTHTHAGSLIAAPPSPTPPVPARRLSPYGASHAHARAHAPRSAAMYGVRSRRASLVRAVIMRHSLKVRCAFSSGASPRPPPLAPPPGVEVRSSSSPS